jgi:hypothetical protein
VSSILIWLLAIAFVATWFWISLQLILREIAQDVEDHENP